MAKVFITSFLAFSCAFIISNLVFSSICRASKSYGVLPREKVAEYHSRVISNLHAAMSCVNAYISLFHLCNEGETIFTSDSCLMNPHRFQYLSIAFSAGYILHDTCACLFLIKGLSTPLMKETLVHHAFVLFGSIAAIYSGHMMITIGVASYFTEISTPFVNYRAFLLTHENSTSRFFSWNNLIFAGLFFLFRVCLYPFLIWRLGYALFSFHHMLSSDHTKWAIMLALTVMYLALYLLQLFWFYKIVGSIRRGRKRATSGGRSPAGK